MLLHNCAQNTAPQRLGLADLSMKEGVEFEKEGDYVI